MKITAIYGSPNKTGNTATIVDAILKGATEKGHQIQKFYLCHMNIHNCMACENADQAHAEKYCNYADDMTKKIIPEIIDSDLLIINSPVYMGHITGATKNFFDRWYTFIEDDHKIRILDGKKYITVVTSGAPTEVFINATEYLYHWLSKFFKMDKVTQIHEGNMMTSDAAAKNEELLKKAEEIGRGV
jgi:multimeric flavodoxin WrbA